MDKFLIVISLLFMSCSSQDVFKQIETDLQKSQQKHKHILIQNKTFTKPLNFVKILAQEGAEMINHYTIYNSISFINCKFEAAVTAYERRNDKHKTVEFLNAVSFKQCEFKDLVQFKGSTFRSKLHFEACSFKEKVDFQNVICMQEAIFNHSDFKHHLLFQESRFYHKASFFELHVEGNMMFQGAVFQDGCNFSKSTAMKYCDFSDTRHFGTSLFNYMLWRDRSTFDNTVFYHDVQVVHSEFDTLSKTNIAYFGKSKWIDK